MSFDDEYLINFSLFFSFDRRRFQCEQFLQTLGTSVLLQDEDLTIGGKQNILPTAAIQLGLLPASARKYLYLIHFLSMPYSICNMKISVNFTCQTAHGYSFKNELRQYVERHPGTKGETHLQKMPKHDFRTKSEL